MKIQILTNVQNGNLKRNRNLIIDAIASFEGRGLILTLEPIKKKRSNPQNSFYWGAVLPLIQAGLKDATGEIRSCENIHYNILLRMFAPVRELYSQESGVCITEYLSSSEMTTTQFMEYIMEIQKWAAEFLNIQIPDPNEQVSILIE